MQLEEARQKQVQAGGVAKSITSVQPSSKTVTNGINHDQSRDEVNASLFEVI